MTLLRYCFLLLWGLSPLLIAEDIAHDVRGNGGGTPQNANGGYFELGIGAAYYVDPFLQEYGDCDSRKVCPSLLVSGAYHYQGAFIELADATYDGLNIGYTLWDDNRWAVDLIALNIFGELSSEDNHSDDPERQKEIDLMQRSRLFIGSGTRITGYFDNTIVQYRLMADLSGADGVVSSLRVGQSWQYRNWNFHSVISADWLSKKASNFLIGVSPEEATTRFPAYDANSSLYVSAEIGFAYPLSDHWVGRAYLRYSSLPKQVSQSPLIDENHASVMALTASYAF
jgi:MipA family protein